MKRDVATTSRSFNILGMFLSVLVGDDTLALADDADHAIALMLGLQDVRSLLKLVLRDDEHKPDAHVEDAIHLVAVDLALALDEVEDRRHLPGRTVDLGIDDLRQHARNVVHESAARYVGHAVDLDLALHELGDRLEEALVHRQKRLAERLVRAGQLVLPRIPAEVEDDLASQREAVRLQSARRQTDDDVSGADGLSGDEILLRDMSDNRSDKVILAHRIQTGHLGGFAAEKRHLVLLAGLAETGHDRLELLGVKLGRADVVHEEQGLRALNQDVVHAVVDDVLPDRVVLVHHRRNLELRADAVG